MNTELQKMFGTEIQVSGAGVSPPLCRHYEKRRHFLSKIYAAVTIILASIVGAIGGGAGRGTPCERGRLPCQVSRN